jgi:Na+-transporting NADH:ubiquinone oxidoreductase subunit NqrD
MTGISRCLVLIKKLSPASILPGCCLLIISSGRLSHAITAAGALVWVYGLTTLVIYAAAKFFPRHGRTILISFLASFMAAVYLFILWLLSPLCALESFFAVSLVPVFYIASGVSKRFNALSAEDSFFSSFFEALSLGVLLLAFAIIREPLSFVSLSLPGGQQGSVMLFSFRLESFLPVQLIGSSGGTLLLLGYFWALYKRMNKKHDGDKNAQ